MQLILQDVTNPLSSANTVFKKVQIPSSIMYSGEVGAPIYLEVYST